jgi:hypothetical protein
VKRQAVVKAFASQLLEVGDRFGGLVIMEFDANVAAIGFDGGGLHGRLSVEG